MEVRKTKFPVFKSVINKEDSSQLFSIWIHPSFIIFPASYNNEKKQTLLPTKGEIVVPNKTIREKPNFLRHIGRSTSSTWPGEPQDTGRGFFLERKIYKKKVLLFEKSSLFTYYLIHLSCNRNLRIIKIWVDEESYDCSPQPSKALKTEF